MKRLSIQLKITLWYSLVMIIVSAAVLVIMTSVSQEILARDITQRITSTVNGLSRRLQGPDGSGGKMPKLGLYEQGVHMEIYDSGYNLITGHIPFALDDAAGFADNAMKTFSDGENKFYIYTKEVRRPSQSSLWIRGVVSVSDENFAIQSAAKTNIILTVVFLLIAMAGGYLITKRALAPVGRISQTAQKIIESQDLSQRIRIGTGTDEIHALANTFDHMLEKIEQMVEHEKQFTSDASHELRTPVAVILSECEYMAECAKTYDEMRESAASIQTQAEKMSKLISELLMISRMDKNTLQASFETVDISELLEFVCDEQIEIHTEDIALHRNIEPGITASADRFLLARLCINIISNAYTYGRPGGNITVSLRQDAGQVVLKVSDDGIGIAKEHLPKIWERFYQADPARSNEHGNMGLGLSMVKWIAECHHGKMDVESEPGAGSTFTLTIPKQ